MTNPNLDATIKAIDNSPSLCTEAKRDAKKIFRAFAGVEEETYSMGDRFRATNCTGTKYMIVDSGNNEGPQHYRLVMINLDSGNSLSNNVTVQSREHITASEFSDMCRYHSEDFARIEKP